VSYEEEDTCVSYEEEDTCVSYEEEDTCMSYQQRVPTPAEPAFGTSWALLTFGEFVEKFFLGFFSKKKSGPCKKKIDAMRKKKTMSMLTMFVKKKNPNKKPCVCDRECEKKNPKKKQ
jgi:hypothetical protein